MVLIVAAIAGVIALIAILYNRLVRDRNRVDAAWSDIDVQLQRRHDLIPQIVKAVDQYAKYERATLEAVTALRAEAMNITNAADIDARSEKEELLGKEVHRLIAVAENYPDLKANENFLNLQKELVATENYLQFARRYYNGSARENNNLVEGFPSMIIARAFGFAIASFFEIELASQRAVPVVNLDQT